MDQRDVGDQVEPEQPLALVAVQAAQEAADQQQQRPTVAPVNSDTRPKLPMARGIGAAKPSVHSSAASSGTAAHQPWERTAASSAAPAARGTRRADRRPAGRGRACRRSVRQREGRRSRQLIRSRTGLRMERSGPARHEDGRSTPGRPARDRPARTGQQLQDRLDVAGQPDPAEVVGRGPVQSRPSRAPARSAARRARGRSEGSAG